MVTISGRWQMRVSFALLWGSLWSELNWWFCKMWLALEFCNSVIGQILRGLLKYTKQLFKHKGKCSLSSSCNPREKATFTHWTGDWFGCKQENLSFQESNPSCLSDNQILYQLSCLEYEWQVKNSALYVKYFCRGKTMMCFCSFWKWIYNWNSAFVQEKLFF
jgi:hypothetical protein